MHPNYPTEVTDPALAPAAAGSPTLSHDNFGIGARVTLAVMSADYAEVILGSLQKADATGLEVQTGDVSTFVAGREPDLLRYLSQLISAAGRGGAHVVATVHLSRGCPGEVQCELPGGAGPLRSEIVELEETGVQAAAEWALYPLEDTGRDGVDPDHMRDIYAAVDYAKAKGTFVKSEHFVTRLEGDIARILETVAAGWVLVGRTVQHVTTHLTLSINSPSAR
ncbi:YkoF family thiamine/hydroxymethylpyrimidine-binding protein [Arthrobacter ginkgonis]|uniref:YkoF family thiamine/hydroxymethylpyrimidine-binding protein n=1 Tax=Arthrobacter ginkgonis TaxID=1630594 RepID=A0ABP7BRU2_9MICC